MTVRELIDGCCANNPEAWARLWELVSSAALFPIRRLLRRHGIELELADDVMQDFYVFLRENNLEHLQAFRGEPLPQFRTYLRTLAVHFTLNFLRTLRRRRHVEARTMRELPTPDRGGPTEDQIRSTIAELQSIMSEKDRSRLMNLLEKRTQEQVRKDQGVPPDSVSDRTFRRWRERLFRKYGRRVV